MPQHIRLSELIEHIQDALDSRFGGETFWITAEITDVKKYADKRWCFLKLIEKQGNQINAEIKGVFWNSTYPQVEQFEKLTGQPFANGLEITCQVRVRFHQRFGLDLEVLAIDHSYTLGKLELERQQTLDRLLKQNATTIKLIDGHYFTYNNQLPLPMVLQRVALITAPNSDGQRDFKQELLHNPHGYTFSVTEFLTQVQGDTASQQILAQLHKIGARSTEFDVVAIIRGGGSQTDFKPFDDYELSEQVAHFPIPVFTGIGHDRNISIVDLMARHYKTPTKVAAHIVSHNFAFEMGLMQLKETIYGYAQDTLHQQQRLILELKESLAYNTATYIDNRKKEVANIKRLVKSLSPDTIMAKGFAMIKFNDKIITDPNAIPLNTEIITILKQTAITSKVTKKGGL